MFGPVQTKLDSITIKRFINCLRGTGKTTQILWSIDKILKNGETCLLITPSAYVIKDYFPDRQLPEGLKVIHIDKLLKYLKNYKAEEHPENKELKYDCWCFHRTYCELFDCDRIVLDPECYIKIIEYLMDRLSDTQKIAEKLSKVWRMY